MRSINFRVWKDGLEYNVRSLVWYNGIVDSIQVYDGTLDGKWLYTWDVLEQFTGLYDENIVGVYEGDIVEVYDTKLRTTFQGVVKFDNASFYVEDVDGTKHSYWEDYVAVIIIGNVHQNPELVKTVSINRAKRGALITNGRE